MRANLILKAMICTFLSVTPAFAAGGSAVASCMKDNLGAMFKGITSGMDQDAAKIASDVNDWLAGKLYDRYTSANNQFENYLSQAAKDCRAIASNSSKSVPQKSVIYISSGGSLTVSGSSAGPGR